MGVKKEESRYCQTKLSGDLKVGSWNSPHGSWSGFIAFSKSGFFFQVTYCFLFNRCIKVWDTSSRHESIFKVMNIPAQSGPVIPKGLKLLTEPFLVHCGGAWHSANLPLCIFGCTCPSWQRSLFGSWRFFTDKQWETLLETFVSSCQCPLMVGVHENCISVYSCPRMPLFNKIVTPEKNVKTIFIFILQQQMATKIVSFSKTESHLWPKTKNGKFYAKG